MGKLMRYLNIKAYRSQAMTLKRPLQQSACKAQKADQLEFEISNIKHRCTISRNVI